MMSECSTGRLMQRGLVDSESTETYFEMHGCPVALYSDKHTVFRVAKQGAQGDDGMPSADTVRAEHRDPVCELQPGQGPY